MIVPFIVWASLAANRQIWLVLLISAFVGVLTFYLFNPPFWGDPVRGIARFLASNLSRSETIPLPVLFLGKVIKTPLQSLPWYNTLLWTAVCTPVGILALSITGGAWSVRGMIGSKSWPRMVDSRWGVLPSLALVNAAFFLVLRALPHTPGHDGIRLFLPAFGCLALLAGFGAARVKERFQSWGIAFVGTAFVEGVVGLFLIFPVPLSYYSPLVGGLPGAAKLGFEPTYYWDAFDQQTITWLNDHTPPGGSIAFAMFPRSAGYLHRTGRLRPEAIAADDADSANWLVLQNRPGMFRPIDRRLLEEAQPAHVVKKCGVPLLFVFAGSDVERVAATVPKDQRTRR
jgi:hypothetical protein